MWYINIALTIIVKIAKIIFRFIAALISRLHHEGREEKSNQKCLLTLAPTLVLEKVHYTEVVTTYYIIFGSELKLTKMN